MKDISICIVNWNTRDLLDQCIDSVIRSSEGLSCELIVVDNASTDGSVEMLREKYPQVCLIQNQENIGFAAANNRAMKIATAEFILLLNSDTILNRDALVGSLQFIKLDETIGVCGIKLINPDGTFQWSYCKFPTYLSEFLMATSLGSRLLNPYYPNPKPKKGEKPHQVDWISGAYMLVRKKVFDQVGGMDETYWMYSEETDWCYRIKKAGWKIYYLPDLELVHLGGASTSKRKLEMEVQLYRSKAKFFLKNYGLNKAKGILLMFWIIFLFRELVVRLFGIILQGKNNYIREEIKRAQSIRKMCVEAYFENLTSHSGSSLST